MEEKNITTKELRLERKLYWFDLKENPRGKFLKISEISNGKSSIIIPESGLKAFRDTFDEFLPTD